MDPLGHLAPWLFKDTIEKENGTEIIALKGCAMLIIYSGYSTYNRCVADRPPTKVL